MILSNKHSIHRKMCKRVPACNRCFNPEENRLARSLRRQLLASPGIVSVVGRAKSCLLSMVMLIHLLLLGGLAVKPSVKQQRKS